MIGWQASVRDRTQTAAACVIDGHPGMHAASACESSTRIGIHSILLFVEEERVSCVVIVSGCVKIQLMVHSQEQSLWNSDVTRMHAYECSEGCMNTQLRHYAIH